MQQFSHGAWINIIYTSHMQNMAQNSNNKTRKHTHRHQHQPNSSSFLPFATLNMHDMTHFYGWILQTYTHTHTPTHTSTTIIFQHLQVHKTVNDKTKLRQHWRQPKKKLCRLDVFFFGTSIWQVDFIGIKRINVLQNTPLTPTPTPTHTSNCMQASGRMKWGINERAKKNGRS